ncbi:sensor histidine kinase [Qipengyuania sp. 483]
MPDVLPFEKLSADHLRLILEAGQIGIWELDIASGVAVRNRRHDAIFGYDQPLDEWTFDMFIDHVASDQRSEVEAKQRAAIASQSIWSFDCAIRDAHGDKRWISAAGQPLVTDGGKVEKIIGHVIDITETKQREARLRLLTDELNHRVRNMLSVIKSIVRLSSRKADDLPTFANALEGRVSALARSHQLLVGDGSASLTPSAILDAEVAALPNLDQRVEITVKDEVPLTGAIGQGLALIFHELTTNALKYGSLSNEEGRIRVDICREGEMLLIEWREFDGPPVKACEANGFGSTLIADAIGSAGQIDLRFPTTGVECDICLKLV